MSTKKYHYLLIFSSFIVCLFIYIDDYFIPTNKSIEIVKDLARGKPNLTSYKSSYSLTTDKTWTTIPAELYWKADYGSPVIVERSSITGALEYISISKENFRGTYTLAFFKNTIGIISITGEFVCFLLLLFYYKRINNSKAQSNLSRTLFIAALIMLYCHLDYLYILSNI